MASRRRSLAPQALASNIPAPTIQKRTSRRASMAVIPEPPKAEQKRGRGVRRPASTKAEKVESSKTEEKQIENASKSSKDDSFVSADTFDFIAMESPKGPMTRSRRSSMFVGSKAKRGGGMFLSMLLMKVNLLKNHVFFTAMPITSTRRKSKMNVVMETPKIIKFVEPIAETIIESPEGEVSFKIDSAAIAEIQEEQPKLDNEPEVVEEKVSPIKVTKRGRRPSTSKTPAIEDKENKVTKKQASAKKAMKVQATVVISPIKKAALKMAFANQAINVKKTPPKSLKMKSASAKNNAVAFPGTPQQTNPANLLKRNLKRKVDVKLDQKVQEIPQNSSPYTLLQGETENGSPVERFVKMNNKPSKENVTGTPAPMKKSRILQKFDQNSASITPTIVKSPDPYSARRRGTPRRLVSLIQCIQCRNFGLFLPLRFLCEINFGKI